MTAVNLATAEEFHAEIARLQAEIDRLRSQPCPYVTGNVTKHCTLTPLALTDAERAAVELAIDSMNGVEDISASWSQRGTEAIATLRGLLERCTKNGTAG